MPLSGSDRFTRNYCQVFSTSHTSSCTTVCTTDHPSCTNVFSALSQQWPLKRRLGRDLEMTEPIEFSFPVPRAPHAILHGRLTVLTGCAIVHLTTSELGESGSMQSPLGSFVYSMPGVRILIRQDYESTRI